MSYHLTAFELTNHVLYMNFPSLERKIFHKDLKSIRCRRLFRCDFVTSVMYNHRQLLRKTHLKADSCHGRNHSQASCEYSLTIFLSCQHQSEYSLLGSKFSTNLLFTASKCHVTIQQHGSSRCSKWPNRMGSLQW